MLSYTEMKIQHVTCNEKYMAYCCIVLTSRIQQVTCTHTSVDVANFCQKLDDAFFKQYRLLQKNTFLNFNCQPFWPECSDLEEQIFSLLAEKKGIIKNEPIW